MADSKVMKELRETREKISEEISGMNTDQIKAYFKGKSNSMINEIKNIREHKFSKID